ncbi:zinc finger protein 816-like [Physella acuta]|uniref:zinc finger protein 816-like n=1 Tax=Physella acuta TaxID=109671 RepID=UPI0027DC8C87|nr:zinc finger protein 816-like [Physella acuta]XP_059178993.1 zinc finger protein 816-like [Physella acuta]
MGRHCSANGCNNGDKNASSRETKISFHSFPLKDETLLKQWLVKMNREGIKPTQYMHLCSEHFVEEDFVYQPFTGQRQLKKGAVPSIFSIKKSHKKQAPSVVTQLNKLEDIECKNSLDSTDSTSDIYQDEEQFNLEVSSFKDFSSPLDILDSLDMPLKPWDELLLSPDSKTGPDESESLDNWSEYPLLGTDFISSKNSFGFKYFTSEMDDNGITGFSSESINFKDDNRPFGLLSFNKDEEINYEGTKQDFNSYNDETACKGPDILLGSLEKHFVKNISVEEPQTCLKTYSEETLPVDDNLSLHFTYTSLTESQEMPTVLVMLQDSDLLVPDSTLDQPTESKMNDKLQGRKHKKKLFKNDTHNTITQFATKSKWLRKFIKSRYINKNTPQRPSISTRHKCKVCYRVFRKKRSLQIHQLLHSEKLSQLFNCDNCSKSFTHKIVYLRHQMFHIKEKLYKCKVCLKCFSNQQSLKLCQKRHEGFKPHQCLVCCQIFKSRQVLNTHQLSHAGKNVPKYQINYSALKSSKHLIKETSNIEDKGKPFKCKFCTQTFIKHSSLKVHVRTHVGTKLVSCPTCNQLFFDEQKLRRHQRTHASEKPYRCGVCDRDFATIQFLQLHEKLHALKNLNRCSFCGKVFLTIQHLEQHEKTHLGNQTHHCQVCNKDFSLLKSFKKHQKSHFKENSYQCSVCKKTYADITGVHTCSRNHKDADFFKCEICSKVLKSRQTLKIHQRIHTGERPYKCNDCTKCFKCIGQLREHEISHSTDSPYKCHICSKSFSKNYNLKRHLASHLKLKMHTAISKADAARTLTIVV